MTTAGKRLAQFTIGPSDDPAIPRHISLGLIGLEEDIVFECKRNEMQPTAALLIDLVDTLGTHTESSEVLDG